MNMLGPLTRVLQPCPDLGAVVQICVDHDSGHGGKGQTVSEGVGHGDVHW